MRKENTLLPLAELRVLEYLNSQANDERQCYMSVSDIAHMVGYSSSYVRKITTRLKKLGLLEKEQMWARDEHRVDYPEFNLYTLDPCCYQVCANSQQALCWKDREDYAELRSIEATR